MDEMNITSDVSQKLRKIRDGCVFNSPTVFVTELLQNSYRARAKRVDIRVIGDTITFTDDGSGCKNPKSILTLDYSEWDTTDEGFGVGFWSILAVPDISRCVVSSRTWRATIDVAALFATGTPRALVETVPSMPGFTVELTAPYIASHYSEVMHEIVKVAELQPFDVFFDGWEIPKKDLFNDVCGEYTQTFSTRFFDAKLAVSTDPYYPATLYYEKREVCPISGIYGFAGVVEMKPKALNLREPDRKDYNRDDKSGAFRHRLEACRRDLYLNFVRTADEEQIDKYATVIDRVLSVDDYERYIGIGGTIVPERESSGSGRSLSINVSDDDTCDYDETDDETCRDDYDRADTTHVHNIVSAVEVRASRRYRRRPTSTMKDAVKRVSKKVWMDAKEVETLSDLKARAEYYGITVFIAKNVLQRNVCQKYGVPHIGELNDGIVKRTQWTDVSLRTVKEENYIALLKPICKKYNLPTDTFVIGKIKVTIITKLRDKVLDKTVMPVAGLCVPGQKMIILDRKALKLSRFHLYGRHDGIGQQELKALMVSLPTIAHELAHLMYNTEDNTERHFKTERAILDELVEMYATM